MASEEVKEEEDDEISDHDLSSPAEGKNKRKSHVSVRKSKNNKLKE